jgi:hypothetical protein
MINFSSSGLVSVSFSNLATIFHYKKRLLDLEKHLKKYNPSPKEWDLLPETF